MDSNLRVAQDAAWECADMIAKCPVPLPDDDEAAGMVIFAALATIGGE